MTFTHVHDFLCERKFSLSSESRWQPGNSANRVFHVRVASRTVQATTILLAADDDLSISLEPREEDAVSAREEEEGGIVDR